MNCLGLAKPEQQRSFAEASVQSYVRHKPGEIILCAGDKAHQFGIMISGAIHVEDQTLWGNISVMGPSIRERRLEGICSSWKRTALDLGSRYQKSEDSTSDLRRVTTRTCDSCGVDIITRNLISFYCTKNIMLSR